MATLFCIFICMHFIHTCYGQSKLTLSTSNVVDIYNVWNVKHPVRHLLDEQNIAGDPLHDPSNALACKTAWLPSSYNCYYPILYPEYPGPAAVIDLQSLFTITNICIYIAHNSKITQWVDYSTTFNFTLYNPFEIPSLSLTKQIDIKWANHWNCFNVTHIGTGFITVSLYSQPANSFTEIVVYGTPSNITTKQIKHTSKNKVEQEKKPLKYLLGTSGYGFNPTNNFTNTIGAIRQWQFWSSIEGGDNIHYPGYPNNQNRYECTTSGFCQDDILKMQRENDVNVHSCVWVTPQWVHAWNTSESNWKPINDNILHDYGATVTPSSYIILADHLFQKAARYGRVAVDHKLLKLAPNVSLNDSTPQPILSGTDLLDWIEVWNEQNCQFSGGGDGGREYFFSSVEIAAMQSAAYDGHMYTMPNTVGIKTADPSMNVSLGGLCGGSQGVGNPNSTSDYFYGILYNWQTILWWSNYYRNGSVPADALNYHFYAGQTSPEHYKVYEMGVELVEWRDKNMPRLEVWASEWGWDSVSPSGILAPPIGSLDSEQVQGMWILRTILALSAAGVQRSNQYEWADVSNATEAGNGCSWCTPGLVYKNTKPKKSYYYFVAMYRNLKNYYFVSRDCSQMNGNVCLQIYEYNGNYAYVLWCPTSEDQIVRDYILHVQGINSAYMTLVTPTVGNPNGKKTTLKVNQQTVILDISELPVFIMSTAN
eukprot:321765_1